MPSLPALCAVFQTAWTALSSAGALRQGSASITLDVSVNYNTFLRLRPLFFFLTSPQREQDTALEAQHKKRKRWKEGTEESRRIENDSYTDALAEKGILTHRLNRTSVHVKIARQISGTAPQTGPLLGHNIGTRAQSCTEYDFLLF